MPRVSCIENASGDHAGGVPPVPIPNTEVKTSRADDTWGASPWESRSSPGNLCKKAISNEIAFLLPIRVGHRHVKAKRRLETIVGHGYLPPNYRMI